MQIKTILRILGILLMIFSLSMLTPLLVDFIFHESSTWLFTTAFLCTAATGFSLWFMFKTEQHELKIRDGFLLVVLFWFVLCAFGSLPFLLLFHHEVTNAVFESVSGFTTTGASIIKNLDNLPHAILFYRQQLQFLGGMGIVVLAVAILPMLGVGGMQLYKAETPGPMKDSKLTPRIAQTAKALWSIYVFLTLLCFLCYWLSGMDWFDAIGESFSTVSTGGFSTHNESFAYYNNGIIEITACFFMFLGGCNFSLHYLLAIKKSMKPYYSDEEFKYYLVFIICSILITTGCLLLYDFYTPAHTAIVKSAFNVISLATTTGFISAPFNTWPTFIPMMILLLAIVGGCGGSTSGGIKVIRALILTKQSKHEITRLLHPHAVIPIKFGKQTLSESLLQSVWAFLSVFIALFLLIMLALMAFGNDFLTAFSAATACLTNAGAGLGNVSQNYADLTLASKWVLIISMIAGRLEIFSLLILFSRRFWVR